VILPAFDPKLFSRFHMTQSGRKKAGGTSSLHCTECVGEDRFEVYWPLGEEPDFSGRLELMRGHLRDKHRNAIRSYAHGRFQEAMDSFVKAREAMEDALEDARSEGVPEEEIQKVTDKAEDPE
jgi:hypothetical protein